MRKGQWGVWMFTRRGKYVVKKLPAGSVVGSATTLLDAADVAMEDARKGPGKWVIEQPVIEVDVSKAYGSLAPTGVPPGQPEGLYVVDVGSTYVTLACDPVTDASHYQWYLDGIPRMLSSEPTVTITGLLGATNYVAQVAALSGGLSGSVSSPYLFVTADSEAPSWSQLVPAQSFVVGDPVSINLRDYLVDTTQYTAAAIIQSGSLPPGLILSGLQILGTASGEFSGAVVFRVYHTEHPAQHTLDSNSVQFTVALAADTTAPPVPTDFAAAGYSTSQVLLTWTNPADDTTVAGQVKSGLSHTGVYKDGQFVAQVLNTDSPNNQYLATATAPAAWKIRSADLAGNRSAFTAEIIAGPTVGGSTGSPENFAVVRTAGTTARLTFEKPSGTTPTAYRVYMSLTEGGTYNQVYEGTPALSGVTYTYNHSTGFTAAQEPWFYATAVVGDTEGAQTNKLKASVGVYTGYQSMNTMLGTASPPQLVKIYIPSDVDANAVDAFGSPDYVPDITAGGGDKGMRLITAPSFLGGQYTLLSQLTFHDYGTNSPPSNIANQRWYPASNRWHHKGDYPSGDKAHRNEGALNLDTGWRDWPRQEERWAGFAVYLPGENDPYGLAPTRAMAAIPGNWALGPQLHATNISGQQGFSPPLSFLHGSSGYSGFGTPTGISHPSGAPVVRYKRASSEPLGSILAGTSATNWADNHSASRNNTASTLLMDWDAVPGASSYRVEYAWRPEGPWMTATTNPSDNITVDLAGRRACATGLSLAATALNMVDPTPSDGISAADIESWNQNWTRYLRVVPIIGGQDGVPSLICPAPNWHLSWGQGDYCEDARPYYGAWIRYVLRLKISTTVETVQPNGTTSSYANNDGYFQVWRNGQEVIWLPNAAIGLNSTKPHYWKMGIYHGHPGRLTTADIPRIPMHWAWRKQVLYAGLKAGYRIGGPTGRTDTDDSAYLAVEPNGG